MPKIKTHSGAKKRFSVTKSGKVKRAKMNRRHILNKMTTKRKRGLRKGAILSESFAPIYRSLIQK